MPMSRDVQLAIRASRVAYVASVGASGIPHLAVSRLIRVLDDRHVTFTGWFCPQTVENVKSNKAVAIAVWDPAGDHGFQLIGAVEDSVVAAVMNGFSGDARHFADIPQEERKLTVRVDAVLEFHATLHSDESL